MPRKRNRSNIQNLPQCPRSTWPSPQAAAGARPSLASRYILRQRSWYRGWAAMKSLLGLFLSGS